MTPQQYEDLLKRFGKDNPGLIYGLILGYDGADYRTVEQMCQVAGELVCAGCGRVDCPDINSAIRVKNYIENIPRPLKSRVLKGYASVFNVVDTQGDLILPGAFRDTLNSERDIPLLIEHVPMSRVPVRSMSLYEDDIGLWISFEAEVGDYKYLSIGWSPVRYEQSGSTRIIHEAELWEVSLVTHPANRLCTID